MGESCVSQETEKGNADNSFPSLATKKGKKCQKYDYWGKFVVLTWFASGSDERKCVPAF